MVFGAVSAYLQGRRPSIATLKALGASGVLIRNTYLIQIGFLALLGVGIGVVIGATAPLALGAWLKDQLPVPALFAVYPGPLIKAATFGLLSAAAFSLAPLARARTTPPASLFRRDLPGRLGFSLETVGAGLAAAGLAALAIITAPTKLAAALMIGGVAISFGLLWLMGAGAANLAGHLRIAASGPVRLGLANLAGPGSAARTAAPAIGLGVALLASVVLIQSSLLRQVQDVAPKSAPALVFTDIPAARAAEFDALVSQSFGQPLTQAIYYRSPVTSGRIIRINGAPVVRETIRKGERWAYDNDIQMAVIGAQPPSAGVVEGHWWQAGDPEPQVAMDAEAARAGRLKVGDQLTINLLGREIVARLAVLRSVEPGSFGPSFSMVISPAAVPGAELPNIAIAKASRAQEDRVTHALGVAFPQVNVISVREQLEAATDIFAKISLAIRSAAGVAALAGILVLAGAIAAGAEAPDQGGGHAAGFWAPAAPRSCRPMCSSTAPSGRHRRGHRRRAWSYLAAWPVVVRVFKAQWSVDWAGVAALVGGASALAAIGGLLAAAQALSQRPRSAGPPLRGGVGSGGVG